MALLFHEIVAAFSSSSIPTRRLKFLSSWYGQSEEKETRLLVQSRSSRAIRIHLVRKESPTRFAGTKHDKSLIAFRAGLLLHVKERFMTTDRVETAQTLTQVPSCPLCQLADQVQKVRTAYERGLVHFQRPPTPRRVKALWPWIIAAALVYGGANFYLFAQLGGEPGFGSWPIFWQVVEVVVIEVVLLIGLVLSVLAFGHLIHTQRETTWRYPAQDERWHNLYYCQRDRVIFDEQRQVVRSQADMERRVRILPPDSGHPTVEDR